MSCSYLNEYRVNFCTSHLFPQRDLKIKHLNREQFNQQAGEVLTALQKLGEKLSAEEEQFLSQLSVSVSLESAMDKMGTTLRFFLRLAAAATSSRAHDMYARAN